MALDEHEGALRGSGGDHRGCIVARRRATDQACGNITNSRTTPCHQRRLLFLPNLRQRLVAEGCFEPNYPDEAFKLVLTLGPGFLGPDSGIGLFKMINALGQQAWNYMAIEALSEGRDVPRKLGLLSAYNKHKKRQKSQARAL